MDLGPQLRPRNRETRQGLGRMKEAVQAGFLAEEATELGWDREKAGFGRQESSSGTREVPELRIGSNCAQVVQTEMTVREGSEGSPEGPQTQ